MLRSWLTVTRRQRSICQVGQVPSHGCCMEPAVSDSPWEVVEQWGAEEALSEYRLLAWVQLRPIGKWQSTSSLSAPHLPPPNQSKALKPGQVFLCGGPSVNVDNECRKCPPLFSSLRYYSLETVSLGRWLLPKAAKSGPLIQQQAMINPYLLTYLYA